MGPEDSPKFEFHLAFASDEFLLEGAIIVCFYPSK